MSTAETEKRFGEFPGNCFRCGEYGHWADSDECPWLRKAATYAEHIARIDHHRDRWQEHQITPQQKSKYISEENKLWYGGKCPPSLTARSKS